MEHMNALQFLGETGMGLNRLHEKTIQALDQREDYSRNLRKQVTSIRGLINLEADRLVSLLTQRRNENNKT